MSNAKNAILLKTNGEFELGSLDRGKVKEIIGAEDLDFKSLGSFFHGFSCHIYFDDNGFNKRLEVNPFIIGFVGPILLAFPCKGNFVPLDEIPGFMETVVEPNKIEKFIWWSIQKLSDQTN